MKLPFNLQNPNFYIIFLVDVLLFAVAFWMAYNFRFDFVMPHFYEVQMGNLMKYVLCIKGGVFLFSGMYRGMWRYTGMEDLRLLFKAVLLQTLLVLCLILYKFSFLGFPRSVFLIDWAITFLLTGGLRVGIRYIYTLIDGKRSSQAVGPAKKVLIVGAGRVGEHMLREIDSNRTLNYTVIGFLDDDPTKANLTIHGKSVLGPVDTMNAAISRYEVDEVFIAMSKASGEQIRSIVDKCKECEVEHKIMPAMGEILDGKVNLKALRDINYVDLLGRSPVELDTDAIENYLSGKTILVTGCGGSIGSELCRQIVRFNPRKLILVDASEFNLYSIEMELLHEIGFTNYETALVNITDYEMLDHVFKTHKPTTVFHAAAYKHVPMIERNPWQAVTNNIYGTWNTMKTATAHGVERFVVVSTDKAVRPTNVMGASKRVTEMLMHFFSESPTLFMAVRFGNVVGSSGSVVPLFRKQIEQGGPVTVTHKEVTRYFMSIPESAQLILQAGTMGKRPHKDKHYGGEIFILDMGTPVKIADMARDLIRLSGKEPDVDVAIEYTGLREGEKLYEELISHGEGIVRSEHEKILVLGTHELPQDNFLEVLQLSLDQLHGAAADYDGEEIRTILMRLVPDYKPAEN
ncbi:MAG: polysaccharide biosynthesis protein [Desulfovibrio sp.]